MSWVRILIAVVAALVALRVGFGVLRFIGRPAPPPPPGKMRHVNLRYQCTVCGAEVKMTSAPDEMPEPPRHCMDEMQLVTGPYD